MEKRLVVTRADNRVKKITELTHPVLRNYAKKCNADFNVTTGPSDEPHPKYHYRSHKIYPMFDDYDRILHIDSDILVKDNCPNLFDMVPSDKVGVLFEDIGSRQENRRQRMKHIQAEREDIGWNKGYTNSGVLMLSNMHREIFNPDLHEYPLWEKDGTAELENGYRLKMLGFEVYELDYTFNHMSMFSEAWNNYASRFESYIIHYAGGGFYRFMPQWKQIKQDLVILTKYGDIKCLQ
jgi:lipopolysaccharide biosynthesis glycosyltransferase